jgi:hypothetical protein
MKIIKEILAKTGTKSKRKIKMMIEIIMLSISIQNRFNFSNMERYGKYTERTYRNNFREGFNFYEMNKIVIEEVIKDEKKEKKQEEEVIEFIATVDWTFIKKSGKKTEELGKFWNGVNKRSEKGLEIMLFGITNVRTNQTYILEANQTPNKGGEKGSRTDASIEKIKQLCENLPKEIKYLVIDGAAAKMKFVDIVEPLGLHLISRLRKDANLKYIYTGEKSKQKGRPKHYDGKIDLKSIDESKFELVSKDDKHTYYSAVVYSVSFKRNIRILYIRKLEDNDYIVLFSTDININPLKILKYYEARFSIEFLIRDAKQFTGLQHCQSTKSDILHFHFNTSLSAVSISKLFYFQNPVNIGQPFSMHDVKTLSSNELLLKSFFAKFNIDHTLYLNTKVFDDLRSLGAIHS